MSVLAGSDMLEALGSRTVQAQTFEALEKAAQDGTISSARVNESLERLSSLARRFPSAPVDYAPEREAADRALAVNAWGRGIVAYRNPVIPRPGSHIVLIAAEGVPGENVAEAGLDGAELARQLSGLYEVQSVLYDLYNPLGQLEAVRAVRASGKMVVFAATSRLRLSADACTLAAAAQPDLTLALWNPYAVLDADSPALITFGYRPEGIEALLRVLRGEAQAIATAPIRL
jgi:beta-N-acetylhexosaminidase